MTSGPAAPLGIGAGYGRTTRGGGGQQRIEIDSRAGEGQHTAPGATYARFRVGGPRYGAKGACPATPAGHGPVQEQRTSTCQGRVRARVTIPWSRCPSPCRPAQKNPRPRPSVPRASRNRRGKDTDHGRGAAGERIGRETPGLRNPSTPPATRSYAFANESPVAAQSTGPGNARRPGAGSRPRRRPEAGCWTPRTDLRPCREVPLRHPGSGVIPEDRRARSWCRSSSTPASASCGTRAKCAGPGSVVGIADVDDEHKRSTPGERALPLAEVLERVGDGVPRRRHRPCA